MDPYVGRLIGQYELRALIGQGGMAVVYRANQTTMSREVAVKIVSRLLTQDPLFRQRFEREVNMVAHLEHANIVPVFDHGTTEDGATYLAMRYIKGGSLAERLRQGPVTFTQAREWLRQVAGALDYAHGLGVVHRDLKPGNILLDEQRIAYLVDFGLARMVELDDDHRVKPENLTKTGAFIGTPAYMSPEQINQEKLDRRSDLYSLGVVLYEMVVGNLPFQTDSAFRMMQAHLSDVPIPPRKLRPDLTPEVEAVLLKALEKKPEMRFQTAGEMTEAFAAASESQSSTVRMPRTALYGGTSRRGRLVVAGLILIVIALLAIGGTVVIDMLTQPPRVDEAVRPATGTDADLIVTQDDLSRAKQVFNGSFLGMVACTLNTDYHATLAAVVRAQAQKYGIDFRLLDSNQDKIKEAQLIDSFVAQGARGIVVCPLDEDAIKTSIQNAVNGGVYIAVPGSIVAPGVVSLTITDQSLGEAVGKYTAQLVNQELNGQANVMILNYPDLPSTVIRAQAMQDALLAGAPNAKIVGMWKGGTSDAGQASMQAALKQFPNINVIMSINDAGAFGAVTALQAAGIDPKAVMIISVDADPNALIMIRQGEYFREAVKTSPTISGQLAVDAVIRLAAGEIVPKQIFSPAEMVNKDNVDTAQ